MPTDPTVSVTNLPSTRSLIVFETACTLKSFLRASESLGMTASAVSQQISNLESLLSVKLFNRKAQGVELTEHGKAYVLEVREILGRLGNASRHLGGAGAREPIRIAAYAPILKYRLFPMLQAFGIRFPDIYLDFWGATREGFLIYREEDLVIEFGTSSFAVEAGHDVLFSHTATPVCSPEFLAAHGPLETPEDLNRAPLLHMATAAGEWNEWFEAAGYGAPALPRHAFRDRGASLAAAEAGAGVALGCRNLLKHHLYTGKLIAPFPQTLTSKNCHFLIRGKLSLESRKIDHVIEWLKGE